MDIPALIHKTMEAHTTAPATDIDTILDAHRWAVAHASELAGGLPR